MDAICPATDPLAVTPVHSDDAALTPYDREHVCITRREYIELRCRANSYKSMHARACVRIKALIAYQRELDVQRKAREAELLAELQATKAELRGLRQRHFGTKSERAQTRKSNRNANARKPSARPRGQQPGAPGHGRTPLNELPKRVEILGGEYSCPNCGKPMVAIAGTKDTEVLEIEVAAHRRVIKRRRYRAGCTCDSLPTVTAAAPPAQLIPRGKLSISVWVEVLLSKYRYAQPTHRFCQDWRDRGVHLAQGTITDGLHRLQPLFVPLLDALLEHLRSANHWHADETLWQVFEKIEAKVGYRWYLWMFRSDDAVYFSVDPSRSAAVPKAILTPHASGVLSVDRAGAYQKYVRETAQIVRALCWAHQRRDFIALAIKEPELWGWANCWLNRIARLYYRHAARRKARRRSRRYQRCDATLRRRVDRMHKQATRERDDPAQHPAVRQLLRLMLKTWPELTVFLAYPDMSLDNNTAERALRPAVVGRKNYYGSGSCWSGELAAGMMSLFATLDLWGINPHTWLTEYLQACARAGGKVPDHYLRFLPWLMLDDLRAKVSAPLPAQAGVA